MNSASAAKTWKTSRPPGVVVSRASCRLLNPTPRRRSVPTICDQVGQRPGQPVQARHDQGVAGPQVVQAGRQLGPVGVLARQLVGEHAEAARLGQGVLLAVQQLAGGADPGVADQRAGPDGRLGGHLRVSTDRQAEHGNGLEVQRAAIRAWAKAEGHKIVAWRTDDGVSGSNGLEAREELALALGDLQDGTARRRWSCSSSTGSPVT